MRNLSRGPRLYELLTILSPDVSEEELPGSVDRIAAYITDAGGTVNETLRESPWGRRRLAYPIRHSGRDVRDGFYTVFHFELDPANVDDVERELRLNDRVIRYLVTHYSPVPVGESAEGGETEAAAVDIAAAQPASQPTEVSGDAAPPAEAADSAEEQTAAQAEAPEAAAVAEEAPAEPAAEEPAAESGDDAAETESESDEADEK